MGLLLLLLPTAFAQTRPENEVAAAVEKFRHNLIDPDTAALNQLVSDQLTFGHSNGKLEDKAKMVGKLVSGKTDWTRVQFSEQTIRISGKTALVRHLYVGDQASGEKKEMIRLRVLLV